MGAAGEHDGGGRRDGQSGVITATDPDGDALTFSKVAGPTYIVVTTTAPGMGTGTGNINLAPGYADAGTASAAVRASDGMLSNDKTLTVTVTNTNRAPTLNQSANMMVNECATVDQAVTGSDPDGDALTFTKTAGPTYMTVTTTNATRGNIHLAPGFSDVGTAAAAVTATDAGALSDSKSFTITVNEAPPPILFLDANGDGVIRRTIDSASREPQP